ncbi:hypothetical protein CNY89_25825, partial [Amaricoccus sp. HAR-UPW-R2A-40]
PRASCAKRGGAFMIGAAIFIYLGLVILGALPSPIPPAASAAMGDLFSDYVDFWRATISARVPPMSGPISASA